MHRRLWGQLQSRSQAPVAGHTLCSIYVFSLGTFIPKSLSEALSQVPLQLPLPRIPQGRHEGTFPHSDSVPSTFPYLTVLLCTPTPATPEFSTSESIKLPEPFVRGALNSEMFYTCANPPGPPRACLSLGENASGTVSHSFGLRRLLISLQ